MKAPNKIYLTPLLVEGCGKNLSKRVTENDAVYIREDLIKAEIERLKATNPSEYNYQNAEGYVWALGDILSFLSTLENKSARQRLAEWSKTPEGRESYEKVAEEMRREADESGSSEIPNDLEEAAEEYVWEVMENDYDGPSELCRKMSHYAKIDDFYAGLREFFIAGAKWQADHTPLPEDTVIFNKGVAEGKRLMMEEAIPCNVFWHDGPLLDYTQEQQDNALERIGAKVGDKVKVIIVKED